MWKSVLVGIILENIDTLRHYQAMKGKNSNTVDSIFQFTSNVITNLPWYFRLPVRMLASIIGLLCLISTGHKLNKLSSGKRSLFLQYIQFIPFFSMLNKLVRSMTFLKLFDILPSAPDCFNNVNIERN